MIASDGLAEVAPVEHVEDAVFAGAEHQVRPRRQHRSAGADILVRIVPATAKWRDLRQRPKLPLQIAERREPVRELQRAPLQTELEEAFGKVRLAVEVRVDAAVRVDQVSAVGRDAIDIALVVGRKTLRGLPDSAAETARRREPRRRLPPVVDVERDHPAVMAERCVRPRRRVVVACKRHVDDLVGLRGRPCAEQGQEQRRALLLHLAQGDGLALGVGHGPLD